ncbi:MAG: serine hydrolase domain-containing protein [Planctomycetota bacterium]
MVNRNRHILSDTICFFVLTAFFVMPIKAASTISSGNTESTEAVEISTRILADGLTDGEKEALELFAERLEGYRRQLNIPGMSAAVIKNGQLIWAEGFGFADLESKVKAIPKTPYHLASLTKTFASQIIMKLFEKGKIDLDDPVKKYGVKISDDPGITVRHLLTHTSEGTPGSSYNYNGYRFGFLGKVIEKASGKSFRELVIMQILIPTEMNDTTTELPHSSAKGFKEDESPANVENNFKRINKKLAKPYALNDSFEVVPGKYPNPDHLGVSTGLISNVIDMAKYDKAIDENNFISKQTQELAYTPAVSNSRKTLPYGLGWFVQQFAGTRLLWHYGWEVSYSALILKVPEENVTFVIFANTDYLSRPFDLGSGDVLNSPFALEFLKTIALQGKFTEPIPQIDWNSKTADVISKLAQVKDSNLKELLKRELISNLMLNHHMAWKEDTRQLMDIYIRIFTLDEFESFGELPVIASIDNVTDNQYKTVEFTLERDTDVRIYAIGESASNIMSDYAGIENAQTGQLVWEMYIISTEHAGGGLKNRKFDRIVPLAAGSYRLHYRSDDSHSFDRWNDLPPDHYWWGVRLFDVTGDDTAREFWDKTTATEELGWSSAKLKALEQDLEKQKTAALMIVTDGKVVFEWGKTTNNIYSHSTRKSLLSALYGIFAAEGKIDTSLTLEQLDIEEKVPLTDTEKQAQVIDLLKARSGVYIPAAAETRSMRAARPKRGSHEPGTNWYYNNWDFNVLGTIFKQLTGEDIYEAFKKRIAEPIGMEDYIFKKQNYSYAQNFSIHPAYPFLISARDMARVGQLFLQLGQWEGNQIIPADWIGESTRSYSDTGKSWRGYGYMWWTIEDDHCGLKKGDYYASGYGGQNLFVLPRMNTIIVHRVNIYLPGINVGITGNAPFRLMPKIMQAYTGQRKKGVPVLAKEITPQWQLLPDYIKIQAALAELDQSIRNAAWIWIILVAVSLAGLILFLCRDSCPPWPHRIVWILATALLGPLGLMAYHYSCRQPLRSANPNTAVTNRRRALYATVFCLTGYFAGVFLAVAYFVLLHPDPQGHVIVAVSYVVPLAVGLMIFRAPFVVGQWGKKYLLAVRRTILTEVVSMNLVLAAIFPVFFFLRIRWFPGDLELTNPILWLIMSITCIASGFIVYPFNSWLCRRGFDAVLVQLVSDHGIADGKPVKTPNLRNIWYVLVPSVILLLVSVYLTVLQIPS